MRRRNGLLAFGSVVLLLTLVGCSASVQPSATTPVTVPDNGVAAAPDTNTQTPSVVLTPSAQPVARPEPALSVRPVAAVSVVAVLEGDIVTIPLSAVEDAVNAEFSLTLENRLLDFMAYELDGEVFVRASACPPCSSRSFALDRETLVCDTCATRFDAWTGEGIDGACVDYPKARVVCAISGDGLVRMSVADLVGAYDATLVAGSGPLEAEAVVAEEPEEVDTRPACCR
jgi:nitrite reductase/ring-hydroxylating ferredoxin subunit